MVFFKYFGSLAHLLSFPHKNQNKRDKSGGKTGRQIVFVKFTKGKSIKTYDIARKPSILSGYCLL